MNSRDGLTAFALPPLFPSARGRVRLFTLNLRVHFRAFLQFVDSRSALRQHWFKARSNFRFGAFANAGLDLLHGNGGVGLTNQT